MPDIERLEQAARLCTLVAIARANGSSRKRPQSINQPGATPAMQLDYPEPAPDDQARTVAADLLQRIALDAGGAPFDSGDPETWDEADATEPDLVSLGPVRLRVVDSDPTALAIACGAIEADSPPTLCLLVEFDPSDVASQACTGRFIVLPTEQEGVSITFFIVISHADLADQNAPDFGPDAVRNEALNDIADHPGRALLVQVLDDAESSQ